MKKIIAMANPYIPTEDKETVIGKKRTNSRSNLYLIIAERLMSA